MAKWIPEKRELLDAMKVGETSIEAAQYFAGRVKQIFSKAKLPDNVVKEVIEKVEEYARLVSFKLTTGSHLWSGQPTESSDFNNMQKNIAEEAASKAIDLINGNLRLDIAINNSAQLLRGYSVEGKALDANVVDSLDKLFNAWLAGKGVISKGSTLYEATENGEIKKGSQGKEIKADAERIKSLLNDKDQGFAQFLDKKGIKDITIQQQEYPGVQKEAQKVQEVKKAPEVKAEAVSVEAEEKAPVGPSH